MTLFTLSSVLIALAAAFGALNYFVLKLPSAIGLVAIALIASIGVMAIDTVAPGLGIRDRVGSIVESIDFSETVLKGMLGFLLFAGALHTDFERLRRQRWSVALAATVGVAISALVVGIGYAWIAAVPIVAALAFGTLISPTDPVAVLALLREARAPEALETRIAGESLFNDGVGYVLFLAITTSSAAGDSLLRIGELFVIEAGGGALLGAATGWIVFQLVKRMDNYSLEVLLTLALGMGTYALADALHLSGPIAVVVAGLLIGNHGVKHGMSDQTQRYVLGFWQLIDEILNAVLFLIIGAEVLAITVSLEHLWIGVAAVVLVLLGRAAGLGFGMVVSRPWRQGIRGAFPIGVWGGLRGGISIALAMSLPETEWKPFVLSSTYIVVIFSILVQGLTFPRLVRALGQV